MSGVEVGKWISVLFISSFCPGKFKVRRPVDKEDISELGEVRATDRDFSGFIT